MDKGASLHCYHWPYLTEGKMPVSIAPVAQ